jgi:hypothetical protein
MGEWVQFCKTKVEKIEKVWNRKLEESTDDAISDDGEKQEANSDDEEGDNALSHEDLVSKMLENIGERNRKILSRSQVDTRKNDPESSAMADMVAESIAALRESRDDTEFLKNKEFSHHTYWRLDNTDQFDL